VSEDAGPPREENVHWAVLVLIRGRTKQPSSFTSFLRLPTQALDQKLHLLVLALERERFE
jgi:hypothetical protein